MTAAPADAPKRGILFACNMNSIRSPMAEIIARQLVGDGAGVESVGVYEGGQDPFIEMILAEDGFELGVHQPKTFGDIDPADFDLIVALTPEAAHEALKHFPARSVITWEIPNPTDERGSREQMLNAYREARDMLKKRIAERFGSMAG